MELEKIVAHFNQSGGEEFGLILMGDPRVKPFNSIKELITEVRSKGKPCFVVFPHEWVKRSDQILAHVRAYLAPLHTVYARTCKVKELSIKKVREFCDLYHIQGGNRLGIVGWGIYHDEDLLGVLSLGRHHRQNINDLILDRLCFRSDIRITGGSSKLFAAAVRWAMEHGEGQIVSFSDNRWSAGKVYEKLNFKLDTELAPDYFYIDQQDCTRYFSKQSQRKKAVACPDDLTEKQWAELRGLVQVYDAGKKRWIYQIKLEKQPVKSYSTRKHGYYQTVKAGVIYYSSSYELRTAYLLDRMKEVKTYNTQVRFLVKGRTRYIDFLVEKTDGAFFIVESKPERQVGNCRSQIKDNTNFAQQNGWGFFLWTEKELGFTSEHYLQAWANQYASELTGFDYVGEKKKRSCERSMDYYQKKIANDKVVFFCEFCQEEHTQLRLTYDKNIASNGRFICIRENGHIQGSKPKDHLRKENPYQAEGKKECNACKGIKPFDEFGIDKTKADGRATCCKACRAQKASVAYQDKRKKLGQ